ncbi:protein GVQW3-like [Mya arenaria]|uniref:protein GVQW3-like n=1 Tax=Mya arenaria TaxID=6604 RepID=UPI0022E6B545|nr:protein GVQW3-like [Mya arenaria]
MSSQEHLEIRANIKFYKEIGKTPSETYKLLKLTRVDYCVCRALVFKWHRRFSDGRQSLEDDAGRGRKSTIGPSAVTSIEEKLKPDCSMTVWELSEAANVIYGTAHSILTTELNMRKVLDRDLIRALGKKRGDIRLIISSSIRIMPHFILRRPHSLRLAS